jgi:hypothetical protein
LTKVDKVDKVDDKVDKVDDKVDKVDDKVDRVDDKVGRVGDTVDRVDDKVTVLIKRWGHNAFLWGKCVFFICAFLNINMARCERSERSYTPFREHRGRREAFVF